MGGYCFWAFVGSLSFGVEYFVRDVTSFSCFYVIISLKPSILYLTELSIYSLWGTDPHRLQIWPKFI